MKILLDAGHGGADPGAQAGGVSEKDIALDITLSTGAQIEKHLHDAEVCYMRIADKAYSLLLRHKAIMDLNPDAFVSIHCNAIDDDLYAHEAEGLEIFYRDENDLKLARSIMKIMGRAELWRKNRGIKQDVEWLSKKLVVLNCLEVPAVLIEIGFISNPREREMILNNKTGIAELIAHGIMEYFNPEANV